jgi:hypothetical protein
MNHLSDYALSVVIPLLNVIGQQNLNDNTLKPEIVLSIVNHLKNQILKSAIPEFNTHLHELIQAANYLHAPHVLDGLIWRYANWLHEHPQSLTKDATLEVLRERQLMANLAQAYFLQFREGIEHILQIPIQLFDFATVITHRILPYQSWPIRAATETPSAPPTPDEILSHLAGQDRSLTSLFNGAWALKISHDPSDIQALMRIPDVKIDDIPGKQAIVKQRISQLLDIQRSLEGIALQQEIDKKRATLQGKQPSTAATAPATTAAAAGQ